MATPETTPFPTSPTNPSTLPESGETLGEGTASYGGGATSVMDRMVKGAHEAVDRFAERARPTVERMQGSMSGASDSMHSRADQLGEMQEQWMEQCRTTVREHPIAAVGVAVLAGMVLSKLISSR